MVVNLKRWTSNRLVKVVTVIGLTVGITFIVTDLASGSDPRGAAIEQMIADIPAAQEAAVADGQVSADELNAARGRTVDCLKASGFDARLNFDNTSSERPIAGITVRQAGDPTATGPVDVMKPLDGAYEDCSKRFSAALEAIYSWQEGRP